MSEASVQGQEVIDPWLTWSVPESGPGYWLLPEGSTYPDLAQQAIPEVAGYPDLSQPVQPGPPETDVVARVLAEAEAEQASRRATRWAGPPADLDPYYGVTAYGGGSPPTFTQTLAGWGLLVWDPAQDRHRPTLRAGYAAAGVGLLAGVAWALWGGGEGSW